jgi:hypothetical protein
VGGVEDMGYLLRGVCGCGEEWYLVLIEFNGVVCEVVHHMHFLSSS